MLCLSPRQVQSDFPLSALVPSRLELQWQEREYFSAHHCSLLTGSASLDASCGGGFCIAVGLIPVQLANCRHKLCNLQLRKCHASICFSSYSILNDDAHFQLSSLSFPISKHILLWDAFPGYAVHMQGKGGLQGLTWAVHALVLQHGRALKQKKPSAVRSPTACGMCLLNKHLWKR